VRLTAHITVVSEFRMCDAIPWLFHDIIMVIIVVIIIIFLIMDKNFTYLKLVTKAKSQCRIVSCTISLKELIY